jgi:hypothetical protein
VREDSGSASGELVGKRGMKGNLGIEVGHSKSSPRNLEIRWDINDSAFATTERPGVGLNVIFDGLFHDLRKPIGEDLGETDRTSQRDSTIPRNWSYQTPQKALKIIAISWNVCRHSISTFLLI